MTEIKFTLLVERSQSGYWTVTCPEHGISVSANMLSVALIDIKLQLARHDPQPD